eukprot:6173964-Ditylum_brightwellii.AAC.1
MTKSEAKSTSDATADFLSVVEQYNAMKSYQKEYEAWKVSLKDNLDKKFSAHSDFLDSQLKAQERKFA